MARQLDFDPMDFRGAILADPAGKAYAKSIRDVGGIAAGAIRERQQKKEAIKKDFIDQMSYDTAITGNNIINNRVASEYGKLRDKHLKVLSERRGWLTPEDTINLRSDMSALTNLANELQGAQKSYENARKMALSKGNKFELNTDAWGDLMGIVSGEQDTGNLIGDLNELKKSDTEFPYLNYKPYDLGAFTNQARKQFRTQFKGDTQEKTIETEKGGKRYISSTKTTRYGDEDQARKFFKDSFLGSPDATNLSKGLQQKLTDKQKAEALQKYGPQSEDPSKTPYLDYYADNVLDPQKFTQEVETSKRGVKPVTAKGKGGLSLFFGSGKAPIEQYKPQPDNVEGVEFDEYVEFAKAGRTPKMVRQVTVSGAEEISDGNVSDPVNLNTPDDYTVAGYSLDKNRIILTKKDKSTGFELTESYMVPYKGNEHFLKGLFDEATLKEIERRASQGTGEVKAEEKTQVSPGGQEQQTTVTSDKWSKYKRQ